MNDRDDRIDIPYRFTYTDFQVDSIRDAFLENGNEDTYASLTTMYFHRSLTEDGLFYAIIAANRDGIPDACYDVYRIISGPGGHFEYVDDETRELALKYLKKGAQKMHTQSLQVLSNYYKEGRYVEKNEALAAELRMKYDSLTAVYEERYRLEQEQEQ